MTLKMNRRGFIRSSTFAAGAALGAPALLRHLTPDAGAAPSQKRFSFYDGRVRELLSTMTLDEKIGQMTQAEQNALIDVTDIEKLFLGSLLSGGSSDPKAGNSLQAWTEMYDGYQRHALQTRLR